MADARTGEIVGEVGSADYFDASRSGWIDMTRINRSPGSTLKPFIYGLAFEQGLVSQETIIEDRPADFFGYRPRNFDMSYQGDVSSAPRRCSCPSTFRPSRLLDAVGPSRLMVRFRRAEVQPRSAAKRDARAGDRPWRRRHHAEGSRAALCGACQSRPAGTARRRRNRQAPGKIDGEPLLEPVAGLECRRYALGRHTAGRRSRSAASPTRPARATAIATPGRSAMTAAMCSACGSGGPTTAPFPV